MDDDERAEMIAMEQRENFVDLIASGVTDMNAAFEVGWTPAKLRSMMADRDFAEIVSVARDRADGTVVESLFRLAKNGNLGAIQMWLYNRDPSNWKDVRRIEVKTDTTINLGLVASTKQAVLEIMREHGSAALEPGMLDDDIIEGDVVE